MGVDVGAQLHFFCIEVGLKLHVGFDFGAQLSFFWYWRWCYFFGVGVCVNFFADYVIISWYQQLCFCIGVGFGVRFYFSVGVIFLGVLLHSLIFW